MGTCTNVVVGSATLSVGGSDVGFTKDGIRVRTTREYTDVQADQFVGLVKKAKNNEQMFVATTLLEPTLANLQNAWDMAAITGSGLGDSDENYKALVIVGPGPGGTTRTFNFPSAVSIADGELNFSRDEESALEVEFEVLKNCTSGSFGGVTDVAPA